MNKPLTREELRLKWIGDRLVYVGYVNRKDISSAFGVSDTQATRDLGAFIAANPGDTKYDNIQKRYTLSRAREMHATPESWRDVGYGLGEPDMYMEDIDAIAQQLADMDI